ncbi:MAG: hypothetical protein GYB68_03535 [Chloroflexi bacterium]|nr:hypothetical protein [Chloroflexota bacterium]
MTLQDAATYTYTARSSIQPSNVLTFTVQGDRLAVDLGAPLERVGDTVAGEATWQQSLTSMVKPAATWLMNQGFETFHLSDVEPNLQSGRLRLRLWLRAGGLRTVPINFVFSEVDNPAAAQAFVDEVRRQRRTMQSPGPMKGLLDYWVTWLVALIAAAFLIGQQFGDDQ